MPDAVRIDPIEDPAWLAFVEASRGAEVFHHPRWLELLRDQYGYRFEARCIAGAGGIEAGIPIARVESRLTGRRLVSLPFSDSCPPLLATGADPSTLDALGRALGEECARSGLDLSIHGPLGEAPGAVVREEFVRHRLPLASDPEELRGNYSKSHRWAVRRARREGLTGARRTDVAALDAFYSLHLRTRRRLGVPTQPKRFIQRFGELFESGLGFVQLVLDEDEPIAAGVFMHFAGTITYKYSAYDAEKVKKHPNNLMLSEAIDWACENDLRTLDFGRTEAGNDGLRSFKRGWGADEEPLPYTYFTDREPSTGGGLKDRIVATTIRRTPPVIGRLAGAALYRHYA